MEESSEKQINNSSKPWLWKKGQSGNILGRPKGKTMKEYVREYLSKMTDVERDEWLEGLSKDAIWKMAEGNPETKTDIKIDKDISFTDEELAIAQQIIEKRLSDTTPETSIGETE